MGHVWSAIIIYSHIIVQKSVAPIAIIRSIAEFVHGMQGNVYTDVNQLPITGNIVRKIVVKLATMIVATGKRDIAQKDVQ
jgi:hypothetical protein